MSMPTNPAEPDLLARITKAADDCEHCIRKDWGAAAKDELRIIRNAVIEMRAAAQAKPAPDDRQRYASGYED